jgi:anti-anti-sigma regulatory factor
MASVGIGMCVDLHNRAKAAKAPVIIVGLSANLMQLFTMLKLTRVFTIVADDVALEKELTRLR